MFLFATTAISLVIILSLLIVTISKHFKEDLQKETMQLLVSQIFFVLTFLIRLALILCVKNHKWADFSRDFNSKAWLP